MVALARIGALWRPCCMLSVATVGREDWTRPLFMGCRVHVPLKCPFPMGSTRDSDSLGSRKSAV